jgi:hypothetical protein
MGKSQLNFAVGLMLVAFLLLSILPGLGYPVLGLLLVVGYGTYLCIVFINNLTGHTPPANRKRKQ